MWYVNSHFLIPIPGCLPILFWSAIQIRKDFLLGVFKEIRKKTKNYAQGAQQAICLAQMAQPPRGGPANQLAVRALKVGGMAQPGIWWVAS